MGVCDPLYIPGTYEFYRTLISTIICVLGAALAAGLSKFFFKYNKYLLTSFEKLWD
jgi:hypothetical protein